VTTDYIALQNEESLLVAFANMTPCVSKYYANRKNHLRLFLLRWFQLLYKKADLTRRALLQCSRYLMKFFSSLNVSKLRNHNLETVMFNESFFSSLNVSKLRNHNLDTVMFNESLHKNTNLLVWRTKKINFTF